MVLPGSSHVAASLALGGSLTILATAESDVVEQQRLRRDADIGGDAWCCQANGLVALGAAWTTGHGAIGAEVLYERGLTEVEFRHAVDDADEPPYLSLRVETVLLTLSLRTQ